MVIDDISHEANLVKLKTSLGKINIKINGCTETDSCLTTLATYIERPKKEVVLSRRNISY